MRVTNMSEKLHKVLAEHGLGSRREMERWIDAGRVKVNGRIAALGSRVEGDDRIQVDGRRIRRVAIAARVLVMNKREGVICTRNDPEQRTTVFAGLPRLARGRWVSVGRLDVSTSGLIMFTNDGALANRLMHPSTGIDREYAVRIGGDLDALQLDSLREGITIDGERQSFSDIQYYDGKGSNHWYHVVLMEGRNREVRRLFESLGVSVSRLKRVRYGPVVLPSWLKRGQTAEMGMDDLRSLYRLLQLPLGHDGKKDGPHARNKAHKSVRSLLIAYPELENLRRAPTRA